MSVLMRLVMLARLRCASLRWLARLTWLTAEWRSLSLSPVDARLTPSPVFGDSGRGLSRGSTACDAARMLSACSARHTEFLSYLAPSYHFMMRVA